MCEQAEYHYFQRDKVELHLPELYHKIGTAVLHSTTQYYTVVLQYYTVLQSSTVLLLLVFLS